MNLQSLDALYHEVRECRNCNLWQSRMLAVPGEGPERAAVMFVGEAPGEREDRTGLPFKGNAGRVFNKVLGGAGLRREEVYITGAVKCRPPKNRDPRSEEIEACNPYLRRQIELVQPGIIVALGRFGLLAATGRKEPIAELRGRELEHRGITVIATYHPAAIFYREELRQAVEEDMRRVAELAETIRV